MSTQDLRNWKNKITNSRRIFSSEDVGSMTTGEFIKHEKAIDYQTSTIGLPSNARLSGSASVVYVKEYTRGDGTRVKAHYRSKPGGIMSGNTPDTTEQGSMDGNNYDVMTSPEETSELKKITRDIFKLLYPEEYEKIAKELGIKEEKEESSPLRKEIEKEFKDVKETLETVAAVIECLPDSKFKAYMTSGLMACNGLVGMLKEAEYGRRGGELSPKEIVETIQGYITMVSDTIQDIKENGLKSISLLRLAGKAVGMINPVLGLCATIATDVIPNVIKISQAYDAGDRAMLHEAMLDLSNGLTSTVTGFAGVADGWPSSDRVLPEVKNTIEAIGQTQEVVLNVEAKLSSDTAKMMDLNTGQNLNSSDGFQPLDFNNSHSTYSQMENYTQPSNYGKFDNTINETNTIFLDPKNPNHAYANELKNLANLADGIVSDHQRGGAIDQKIGDYKITDVKYNEKSNYKSVVYEKGDTIIVAQVGTDFGFQNVFKGDFGSIKDLGANLKMVLNMKSAQMREANEHVKEIKRLNPDKTIIVVGHSEGGSEAIYAGVQNGVEVYTFNAFGVSNRLLDGKSTENITNYRTSNDIVSGTKMPQGEVYTVKSDQSPILAKTPLGVKGGHQIQKMPDLENSIPHSQYRQENSPLRNINFGQNLGSSQNQNILMQMHQNAALQQMIRDGVFSKGFSQQELEIIFYMYLSRG